jgi:hypothetical protein
MSVHPAVTMGKENRTIITVKGKLYDRKYEENAIYSIP